MIPESEFTDERIGGIIEGGLRWINSEWDMPVFVSMDMFGANDRELGAYVLQLWDHDQVGVEVYIGGNWYAITKQTIVDGVNRQLADEGYIPGDDRWCMHCLWGASDVAASILQWGLGFKRREAA